MKLKIALLLGSAALAFAACNNSTDPEVGKKSGDSTIPSDVKEQAKPAPHAMPDSATMMKNWMAYSTPGDVQKMLAESDGTWDFDAKMWQMPGAPVQTSKGTTVNKMILDGRYQLSVNKGNMMGMPFEGQSTLAYDNAKKEFVSTWIDNMGTGIMVLKGSWDEASKTITLKGKMVDPGLGDGTEIEVRETMTMTDKDNQIMQMFCPGPDGKEFKNLEINYTRKK